MKRRIFNTLTIVSLILCLATAGFWVRSYWQDDFLYYEHHSDEIYIQSMWGRLLLSSKTNMQSDDGWYLHTIVVESYWILPPKFGEHNLWGFGCTWNEALMPPAGRMDELAVPHWFVVALTFLPFAMFALSHLKQARQRSRGLCLHCGYDLRATPERCPECGAVPTASMR